MQYIQKLIIHLKMGTNFWVQMNVNEECFVSQLTHSFKCCTVQNEYII